MAAVSSVVAGALVASAVAGVASAGYSMYQGQKQAKEAKKAQKEQQAAINAERQRAEADRKGLISQQRYQMGLDRDYSTSSTSSVGRGLTTGESTLG